MLVIDTYSSIFTYIRIFKKQRNKQSTYTRTYFFFVRAHVSTAGFCSCGILGSYIVQDENFVPMFPRNILPQSSHEWIWFRWLTPTSKPTFHHTKHKNPKITSFYVLIYLHVMFYLGLGVDKCRLGIGLCLVWQVKIRVRCNFESQKGRLIRRVV